MMVLLLFYLFSQASSENHALTVFVTASSGLSNILDVQIYTMVDDNSDAFCDGSNKTVKANSDWVKAFFHDNHELLEFYRNQCFEHLPNLFRGMIAVLNENFKQPEGNHILQMILSCALDEETQNVKAVLQFGYNAEDFMILNLDNLTWVALQPQAISIKVAWNADIAGLMFHRKLLTQMCPQWLKGSLDIMKSIPPRTDHPSLSLLQRLPFSPVSCHATGFYPNRALLFWRKDGEEIHENVDHGEILPNNDGTFQMRVYLNISSISPEDWRRYDCVFQLIAKEEKIIKLDEASIRTNRERTSNITIPIIATVITFVLVSIAAAAGYVLYKRNTAHGTGFEVISVT
ncbi:major histocompatibility complex class I-related gene protein-like [Fundulus heteroclitus]|uniref:major histocompatibility complex class I-related gene protein-like n=1 Tax=Fundulus heteroclitus TaxID=8078 RepID=UPI00165A1E4D|nr:major histocompatibility complex class I-related gene protein-like [Fundulus heteroclitus]